MWQPETIAIVVTSGVISSELVMKVSGSSASYSLSVTSITAL